MKSDVDPQSLSESADADFKRGNYQSAFYGYKQAADIYQESGDKLAFAEMANNACVASLQSGDPITALNIVKPTPMIFAEFGNIEKQGMAFGNIASAMEANGEYTEAYDHYKISADLLEEAGNNEFLAHVLYRLATLALKNRQFVQAAIFYQRYLATKENLTLKEKFVRFLLNLLVSSS